MERKPFRLTCQITWLAVMVTVLTAACPAVSQRGRTGVPSISIVNIGRAAIEAESLRVSSFYYVNHRESVTVKVSGPLPRRARLYSLVRRLGGGDWIVQQALIGPGGRNARGEWKGEALFGTPGDVGSRFELLVIAAAEPLSQDHPLPDGIRKDTPVVSEAVLVERRRGRPFVGISAIGGSRVYGDEEIEVRDLAKVAVVARDLPDESDVGVVVHPATTDLRWVMMDRSSEGPGEITTFFGTGEPGEDFFRYTVTAFVARRDQFPPEGVAIPPREWAKHQARFLAESRRVRVIRWEGEFKIRMIGGLPVLPNRILLANPQDDVQGAVQRKLHPGERIWILCVPQQGDPWVAGWTSRLRPSGQWVVNAASLWREGRPARFDVVAVLSDKDATRMQPGALRTWLHNEERPLYSARVQIKLPILDKNGAPHEGRRP